jgi:putative transposase
MPRIARDLQDNLIYHVLNRGNGQQEVFHENGDYAAFIQLMREAKKLYEVKIFGYCLMPNHFHLVLSPIKGEELSQWMQWLMISHVRRYHKYHGKSGHIWQGRFKSFAIEEDNHFLMVLRYVEANPVRAGLVSLAKDWPWSSHKDRIEENKDSLIDDIPLELPPKWDSFVNEPLAGRELEKIRRSVNRQFPYGEAKWQLRIRKEENKT